MNIAFFPLVFIQAQSALDPAGPQAGQIHTLWNLMLYTLSAVFVIVMVFLMVAAFSARRDGERPPGGAPDPAQERRLTYAVGAGVGATVIILFVLLVSSFLTGRRLYALPNTPDPLTITVTGRQWWWQVKYEDPLPSRKLTTANEIHIPVGRPVLIRLKSVDVIHSFWVPNLHGKTDLIPGHDATTWIRADKAGVYRGQCAEFCGHQHAHMAFTVLAQTEEEFRSWYDTQLQPAMEPTTAAQSRGREVFLSAPCIQCHRIQGTNASATLGPDLTHVASRPTLAAGTLDNTRENLSEWVFNSQRIKPGNNMPPNPLQPADLEALLDYLESLK